MFRIIETTDFLENLWNRMNTGGIMKRDSLVLFMVAKIEDNYLIQNYMVYFFWHDLLQLINTSSKSPFLYPLTFRCYCNALSIRNENLLQSIIR